MSRGTGRILAAFFLGLGALSSEEFNKSGHFRALRRNTVFGNVRATFGRDFGRPIGLGAAATVQGLLPGTLHKTGVSTMTALWLIVLCGVLAIVYAAWATRSVLAADAGNARMQEIAAAVREGAQAYLKRQYTTIGIVGVVIFFILGYFLGWLVAFGFLIGAVLSGAAGFIGMNVSVRANVRTAQAAIRSLAGGLELAFKAGAITGLLVAGLALLGVTLYFGFLIGTRHWRPMTAPSSTRWSRSVSAPR